MKGSTWQGCTDDAQSLTGSLGRPLGSGLLLWSTHPHPVSMSLCSCGWQTAKKSLEAGSHFKENCFILLPPKGLLSRLQDWELRCTPRMGQIEEMWHSYSSFKPFGKETKSKLAPERWVLGRDGHRQQKGGGHRWGQDHCVA